ncbi:uncharacterized protein LOC144094855 isoform X2 [Amblyomma americanum]
MHHTLLQNRTCVHVVLLLAKGLKHSVTGCCVRMAVKGSVLLLSVVVAFVSVPLVSTCGAQESVGCPPVDDWRDNATLLANPLNCSTFYICSQRRPKGMRLPVQGQLRPPATSARAADGRSGHYQGHHPVRER